MILRDQQPRKVSSVSHDGFGLAVFPYHSGAEWRDARARLGERSEGIPSRLALFKDPQEGSNFYELCFVEGLENVHRVVPIPREILISQNLLISSFL